MDTEESVVQAYYQCEKVEQKRKNLKWKSITFGSIAQVCMIDVTAEGAWLQPKIT